MLRYTTIAIASIVLFFPTYWLLHPILGADVGAGVAAASMYIGFPALMLHLWKQLPPIYALPVDPDDPEMIACIRRSRSHIRRFKKGLADGAKQALVKYPIRTKNDGTEHVWGVAHSIDGQEVVVSLVNEPVDPIRDGEMEEPRSKVPLREIEDWMLIDKEGRCEGGYTHLALLKIYRRRHGRIPKTYLRDMEFFVDIDASEYNS